MYTAAVLSVNALFWKLEDYIIELARLLLLHLFFHSFIVASTSIIEKIKVLIEIKTDDRRQ